MKIVIDSSVVTDFETLLPLLQQCSTITVDVDEDQHYMDAALIASRNGCVLHSVRGEQYTVEFIQHDRFKQMVNLCLGKSDPPKASGLRFGKWAPRSVN